MNIEKLAVELRRRKALRDYEAAGNDPFKTPPIYWDELSASEREPYRQVAFDVFEIFNLTEKK